MKSPSVNVSTSKMSDPPYASAPIHGASDNVLGTAVLVPPDLPHTSQIGRPHNTGSIDSNKSGRLSSIVNGAASLCGITNRHVFNKVCFRNREIYLHNDILTLINWCVSFSCVLVIFRLKLFV